MAPQVWPAGGPLAGDGQPRRRSRRYTESPRGITEFAHLRGYDNSGGLIAAAQLSSAPPQWAGRYEPGIPPRADRADSEMRPRAARRQPCLDAGRANVHT